MGTHGETLLQTRPSCSPPSRLCPLRWGREQAHLSLSCTQDERPSGQGLLGVRDSTGCRPWGLGQVAAPLCEFLPK